jgi:hypothetical protein
MKVKIASIICYMLHVAIVFIALHHRDIYLLALAVVLLIINATIFTLLEQYRSENKGLYQRLKKRKYETN